MPTKPTLEAKAMYEALVALSPELIKDYSSTEAEEAELTETMSNYLLQFAKDNHIQSQKRTRVPSQAECFPAAKRTKY